MKNSSKIFLFLLRISLGWMYLYAGLTKLLDPDWTSLSYLESAKGLGGFYAWLATPMMLPIVDFTNEWGLTLLGVSLILGLFVRLSGPLGALLMLLYYIALGFPHPNTHAFIVDEHVIYIFALLYLASTQAGRVWALENLCRKTPLRAGCPVGKNH